MKRQGATRLSIAVIGAGKVGRGLARALTDAGHRAVVHPARRALPKKIVEPVLVLAVRDAEVAALAARLAQARALARGMVVLHVAGSLGAEVLAPLRGQVAGLGVAHPLLSFASTRHSPELRGGLLLVAGDAAARRAGRALARALGMRPRAWTLDLVLYHAAAVVVSNGAAALASAGQSLLVAAGAPPAQVRAALAPLLASVAGNVAALGLPHALTGPVRRGDAATVERHLKRMQAVTPELCALYTACARAQLPMARALGEASPAALRRIAMLLDRGA